MKVADIMLTGEANAVVLKNTCFRDVLEIMDCRKLGAVSVVDDREKLVGIITDGDIRRLLLKTQDPLPELFMKRAEAIMIKNPKTIGQGAGLQECLAILEKNSFWVLPVVDENGKVCGMVHMQPLLKALSI